MDLEVNNYNVDTNSYTTSENVEYTSYTYEPPTLKYVSNLEPLYKGTQGSAGLDLYAYSVDITNRVIGTGVYLEIPQGWVGLVVPRSSTGNAGFKLRNTMGVIDADYRGEVLLSYDKTYTPTPGEKIAQLVVVPHWDGNITRMESVSDLSTTERGSNGFGSTGG